MTTDEIKAKQSEYAKIYWRKLSVEERQRRTKRAHERYRAQPEKRAKEKAWRERPEVRAKMLRSSYEHHRKTWPRRVYLSAKIRSAKRGIPFSITVQDIVVPEVCPVLGIPFKIGSKLGSSHGGNLHSPSLDRKIPALGYVPGNVGVISLRANLLKNSATLAELEAIVEYCKG